jgi:hypothetical protein
MILVLHATMQSKTLRNAVQYVALVKTNVSVEFITSIIRVTKIRALRITLSLIGKRS